LGELPGALLASEFVGVAEVDERGGYVRANMAFATMSGISVTELTGRPLEGPLAALVRPVLERGVAAPRQMIEIGRRSVVVECQPLEKQGAVLLIIDVTGQRAAQRVLDLRLRISQAVSHISARFIDQPASQMDGAINEGLREVGTELDLDAAQLGRVAGDGLHFGHRWFREGSSQSMTVTLDEACWRTEQVVDDVAELPPATQPVVGNLGRIAIMPLELAGTVVGAAFFGRVAGRRSFGDDELHGLRLATQIFASALDRKHADEALADRLSFERVLRSLSTRLVRALPAEIDDVLNEALERIRDGMGFDRVSIIRHNKVTDIGEVTHEALGPGIHSFAGSILPVGAAEFGWPIPQIMAGETVIARRGQLPADAANARDFMARDGLGMIALVPIMLGGTFDGFIGLTTRDPDHVPSEDILRRLRLVGDIVAGAIARKRGDEELARRLAFEGVLLQASTRLIHAPTDAVDAVLGESLHGIRESMGFARVVLQLIDQKSDRGVLLHESCAPGVRSYANVTLGGKASEFGWPVPELMTGQTMVMRRDRLPEQAVNARRLFERDELGAMTLVPLMIGGHCDGYIGFHAQQPGDVPSEEVLRNMRLLGHIVANALARKRAEEARARAYRELERMKSKIEQERDYLREQIQEDWGFREIIGRSESMRRTLGLVDAVAATPAAVLLRGESGVGKELFARAIHARSDRQSGPLVKVNCASIPRELFESEFFGHVRGAFTGALKDRTGRFELAAGGTLFLDEVGEIPIELQAKLLRVLQENEFERVGDDRTRRADVRLVAATNRNLEADVAAGRVRPDLFYRLNVFPIVIPPLRERIEDIVPLAEHFLAQFSRAMGRPGLALSDGQRDRLRQYDWPGNVRELQHVMERSVIISRGGTLQLDVAASQAAPPPPPRLAEKRPLTDDELRSLERSNIVDALERARWRITGTGGAAELLGLRPSTLRDRMKSLGIRRPAD
jgi:transcriptional regulator with GAF, ATPase, and Fis domain